MSKIDNLQQINTNTPRETLVYEANGLVLKRPGPKAPDLITWLTKQQHAKLVSDKLKNLKNNYYFVPSMLEISTSSFLVIEEKVKGHPITSSYFDTLTQDDKNVIYKGFAHFINDINQSRPILTQNKLLDSENDAISQTLTSIISKMKIYFKPADIAIIKNAQQWFNSATKDDESVVFAHGDMNENNIFYDTETKTLSIIDFADSKYQTISYMFNTDLAKLGWLDIDRLVHEYEILPRKQNVNLESSETVKHMRQELQNFKWSATEFLKNPKSATQIRLNIIYEIIKNIQKINNQVLQPKKFTKAQEILDAKLKFNTSSKAKMYTNESNEK